MSMHKSYPEIVGTTPVDTGSTPGQSAGVRSIQVGENVDASIVNRAIYDAWINGDLLNFFARKEIAQPTFVDRTSSGESTYDLTGRIYCGESAADDTPERLFRYFKITDQFNNPLVVDNDRVIVKEVLDPTGTTQVGTKRDLVTGTINITYNLQTLTHTSGSHLFTYCQPGDEVVLSGGTANDGTYVIAEVLSDYSLRIRSTTGTEVAFTAGTINTTLLVRTNGYSSHRKDGGETYDSRIVFSKEIPAAVDYRIHYHVGVFLQDVSRILVGGMRPQDAFRKAVGLQQVYEGSIGAASPNRQGGLGSQRIQNTRGEIVFDRQSVTQGIFGASLRDKEASTTRGVGVVLEQKYPQEGAAGLHIYKKQTVSGLSIEAAVANKITDKTLQTNASADLSTIAGNIVQSNTLNFITESVTVGMTLRVTSDPTVFYRVIDVAPGGDPNRLRLYPDPPPSWTNESFEIYSRVFELHVQPKIIPNNTLAVAYANLPSTSAGSTTLNSDIFEDLTTDFSTSGVMPGDLLFILSEGMNASKKYVVQTVAPGGNIHRLQMTEEFLETASNIQYKLLDPVLLEGRAFIVEDARGAQLTVSFLNNVSSSWGFTRDNISVDFYDVLSAQGNAFTTLSGEVLTHSNILSVQSRHTQGLYNNILNGIANHSILPANDLSASKGVTQITTFFPQDLTKGLRLFSSTDWVGIGEHEDSYVDAMGIQLGDIIVPLEGDDRNVEMTVVEKCAAYVRVSPAPTSTWGSAGYPVPFFVKRIGGNIRADGSIRANRFFYESAQTQKKQFSALSIQPDTGSSTDFLGGLFRGTSTPWTGLIPIPLQAGDVLRHVEVRNVYSTAATNPNTGVTLSCVVINKNTGSSTKTLLTPYEDGGGPGLGLNASVTAGSKIILISGASGNLNTLLAPGCYLLIDAGGTIQSFRIEAVPFVSHVAIAEAHTLTTGIYDALITNGYPVDTVLNSFSWVTSYVLQSPYTVLEGDYIHLAYTSTTSGAIAGFDIYYTPGGLS